MVEIGDKIKIISNNYIYSKYKGKLWTVTHIARSIDEHPGYDIGVGGNLINCEGLPFSLYNYEFEVKQ